MTENRPYLQISKDVPPEDWRPTESWLHQGPRMWEPDTSGRSFYEVTWDGAVGGAPFEFPNEYKIGIHSAGPYFQGRGFPDYDETAILKFNPRRKRIADWYKCGKYWVISDRTKTLFEGIDPGAFDFRPTISTYGKAEVLGGPYWLCNVIRTLDAIDVERSELWMNGWRSLDGSKFYQGCQAIHLARFKPEIVGNSHVFDLTETSAHVVDNVFVEAIQDAKITGLAFKDFQSIERANRMRVYSDLPPLDRPA